MDQINGGREGEQYQYILPLTSPICCFKFSTVQPCHTLIALGGPTTPLERATTDALIAIHKIHVHVIIDNIRVNERNKNFCL